MNETEFGTTPGPWSYIDHNWRDTSVFAEGVDHPICTLSIPEETNDDDALEEL